MRPIAEILAEELGQKLQYIDNVIALLDEGNTIPFIARYRKEMHGAMDDTTLRALETRLNYLRNLNERKEEVCKSIASQEKLTEEQVAIVFTKWNKIEELTKREKEIVKYLLLGDKRKDIAQKIYLSDSSVRNHITRIFKKLEVESTIELCKKAKKKI